MTGDPALDALLAKLSRTAHNPRAPRFHRKVAALACTVEKRAAATVQLARIAAAGGSTQRMDAKHGAKAEIEAQRARDRALVADTLDAIERAAEPVPSQGWRRLIALAAEIGALWLAGGAAIYFFVF